MEGFVLPLALAAFILPVLFLGLPPVLAAWRRRHEPRRVFTRPLRNLDRRAQARMPSADETAETVERFRKAVRRSGFADYFRPGA
jgi:hypothetical protein